MIAGAWLLVAFVVVFVLAAIGGARTRDPLHVCNAVIAAVMLVLLLVHALRV